MYLEIPSYVVTRYEYKTSGSLQLNSIILNWPLVGIKCMSIGQFEASVSTKKNVHFPLTIWNVDQIQSLLLHLNLNIIVSLNQDVMI